MKRYTKEDVKRELKLAKRRLKTVSSHTGLEFDIKAEYYLSMKSRKEAVKQLKAISYKNAEQSRIFKHIDIISNAKLPHGKTNKFKVEHDLGVELISNIKGREKTTKEKVPVNLQSNAALSKVNKWYKTYANNRTGWLEHLTNMNDHALNNYKENIRRIKELSNDPLTSASAEVVLNLLESGQLTLDMIANDKALYKISEINLFDSDPAKRKSVKGEQTSRDQTLGLNGEHIMQVLTERIPLDKNDIADVLLRKGYDEDTVKELISFI